MIAATEGMDVVINLTHLKFNNTIMSDALAAKTHYVGTVSNTPFLEDWISGEEHKLHQGFKEIGKTALARCGRAPKVKPQ